MSEQRYKIIFRGEIAYGYTIDEVKANLRELCRYDQPTLEKLFSGNATILKSKIDETTARKYKAALDRTGAVCRIEPMAPPRPAPPERTPPAAAPSAAGGPTACPACGQEQEGGISCVRCGIVFAKYERARARKAALAAGGGQTPAAPVGRMAEEPTLPAEAPLSERIAAYFARHQEQAFILKAFALIAGILLLRQFLSGWMLFFIFLLFPIVFLAYIRLHAATSGQNPYEVLAQHITFMPVMYTEGERKKEGTAWLTYGLIFVNIVVFYGYELRADPEFLFNNLIFLPGDPNPWNVPLSAFTSIFLHADNGHLWGNMLFLWAVGTVVERRIGWQRFLAFYLLGGLMAGVLSVVVERTFLDQTAHGLGASGAIAGIMGVFAVRCYFKSMVFPLPILGIFSLILPVSLKVRLNSLVIIGLFFLADLSGGIGQITGESASNIGHWAHIGGMLCGIVLASFLKLGDQAIEERHMEIGSQAWNGGGNIGLGAGEESLRLALKQNPDNVEAMLLLARIQSKYTPSEEGRELYRRAIALLAGPRPKEAAAAFKEYFLKYLQGVEPALQVRLANIFYQQGDLDMASRCLEMVSQDEQASRPIREKAMFQCARVLEELGFDDAAVNYYALFVDTFPESPNLPKARARLGTA